MGFLRNSVETVFFKSIPLYARNILLWAHYGIVLRAFRGFRGFITGRCMAFYDTEFAEWGRALIMYPENDTGY
jgi:hypothetical protein